jgi:hypothetical protein
VPSGRAEVGRDDARLYSPCAACSEANADAGGDREAVARGCGGEGSGRPGWGRLLRQGNAGCDADGHKGRRRAGRHAAYRTCTSLRTVAHGPTVPRQLADRLTVYLDRMARVGAASQPTALQSMLSTLSPHHLHMPFTWALLSERLAAYFYECRGLFQELMTVMLAVKRCRSCFSVCHQPRGNMSSSHMGYH